MLRLALIPVLLAGAVGCEADGGDEGLLVTRNVAPTGTSCIFTGDETESFFAHGFLTTQLIPAYGPTAYLVNPQIKSRITALDTEIDMKTVITSGADIDISFADDSFGAGIDDSLLHFRQLFTAPIEPNGGITDASFVLLPEDLVSSIAQAAGTNYAIEVITKFTVHGSMSGADVSSQEFTYAVTVSDHGIANIFPANASSTMTTCAAPSGTTVRAGNPCNIAQDLPIDCCTTNDGGLVCPAGS